jgi:hypothetical protein
MSVGNVNNEYEKLSVKMGFELKIIDDLNLVKLNIKSIEPLEKLNINFYFTNKLIKLK